jgi:hypothetical protein
MSDVIQCDGCNKTIAGPLLSFDVHDMNRLAGGDIISYEAGRWKWPVEQTEGDLCGDCATEVMDKLNEVLKHD